MGGCLRSFNKRALHVDGRSRLAEHTDKIVSIELFPARSIYRISVCPSGFQLAKQALLLFYFPCPSVHGMWYDDAPDAKKPDPQRLDR